MAHQDMTTEKEVRMSTPYNDVATWRRILAQQLRLGESRFRGPPGLLDKMVARLSFITAQEMTSAPSTPITPTEKT